MRRSSSPRMTGRPPPHPHPIPQSPARHRRETTWSSRPGCSDECAAVGGDGRDSGRVRRSRRRVLHDPFVYPPRSQCADVGRVRAGRSQGPEHHGRARRPAARRADRGAAEQLEGDDARLRSKGNHGGLVSLEAGTCAAAVPTFGGGALFVTWESTYIARLVFPCRERIGFSTSAVEARVA